MRRQTTVEKSVRLKGFGYEQTAAVQTGYSLAVQVYHVHRCDIRVAQVQTMRLQLGVILPIRP